MKLHRVILNWAGPQIVGTAVTVLHFDGSNQTAPPVAAIKTAFGAAADLFPNNVTITFPAGGDSIEDTTGDLNGVWTSTGGGTVTGTSTVRGPAGVGACISWSTGGIVPGKKGPRRLRGRTFLVPIGGNRYDDTGTLDPTGLSLARALGEGIRGAGALAVWHRPSSALATDGNSYGVLSSNVRDKVAFLSSRRD